VWLDEFLRDVPSKTGPTLIVGEHALSAALDRLQVGPIQRAGNGAAALVMLREDTYELVISDWSMEPVSGLQLLKFIRAEPPFDQVRFVISVPAPEKTGELVSRQDGADGLLVEPFSSESLADTMRGVLRDREILFLGRASRADHGFRAGPFAVSGCRMLPV
jgi:two-component system, chemotaxis family, chemotaxis protein CheY